MSAWNEDNLDRVARAEELRIAGRLADGTLRKAVIIWHVRVGDSLYVRSVNGPDAAWFTGTQVTGEGHIDSGGVSLDVTFVRDATKDAEIDRAYTAKYGTGKDVVAIVTALATSTTLRVDPR